MLLNFITVLFNSTNTSGILVDVTSLGCLFCEQLEIQGLVFAQLLYSVLNDDLMMSLLGFVYTGLVQVGLLCRALSRWA